MSSKKPLKLLVCSGNLGNAEPDLESLNAWVPADGLCHQVVDDQKYPVVVERKDFQSSDSDSTDDSCLNWDKRDDGNNKYREDEKAAKRLERFDLIVFGMQESTFEVGSSDDDEESEEEVEEDLGEAEESGNTNESKEILTMENLEVASSASSESIESTDVNVTSGDETSGDDSKHKKKKKRSLRKGFTKNAKQTSKSALKHVSKTAKKTGKHVSKQGKKAVKLGAKAVEKATGQAEKVARKGAGVVNTLAASRNNTRDNGEYLLDGTSVLHELLETRLPSYRRLLSYQRGEMRLIIYSLNQNHSVHIKSTRAQNTGVGGLANKGGIVAEVIVDRGTVLSFMTCHLEAHEGEDKYDRRIASLAEIFKGTKKYALPSIYPDASLATHFCFILGDLNFRTRYEGRIKYDEQIDAVNHLVAQKRWEELNNYDELRLAIEKKECLNGFKTLYCNFPPTFKVERENGYKYKANRTPSYTDRILWRTGDLLEDHVVPLAYGPVDQFTASDHKPIRGAFDVRLNQGIALRKKQNVRTGTFAWKEEEHIRQTEVVQLNVSGIQADILVKNSDGDPPDSYVCLVSSPEELLLKKPTTLKQVYSAAKKFLKIGDVVVDIDKAGSSKSGWPRTRVMKKQEHSTWNDEVLQCHLRPLSKDGIPINLTGAILHIFVFKYNSRQTDEVIGSYPINLEHLFNRCIHGDDEERSGSENSVARKGVMWAQRIGSTVKTAISNHHDLAENSGVSLSIDGPLLKNGRQTGRLRCNINALLKAPPVEKGGDDSSETS